MKSEYKVGTPSRSSEAETKKPLKSQEKTKYLFTKKINRLSSRRDIEYVLNHKPNNKTNKYYGNINGIEVRIDFSITKTSLLCVKQKKYLKPAYYKILNILNKRIN